MANHDMIQQAAELVSNADALLITAGAGMGVDSGLPDFRGNSGFWRAYPALEGYAFEEMANPRWFSVDPHRAWGFYGHRLNLYRQIEPHQGFKILRSWSDRCSSNCFIFTSNVDGQFQKAGFADEMIVECHGSIHYLQEFNSDGDIVKADMIELHVDEQELRVRDPLPSHPDLDGIIRPNILMFGDWTWNDDRTTRQEVRLSDWVERHHTSRVAIIEMGAGTTIPSVRYQSESFLSQAPQASLIRINPREAHIPDRLKSRGISLYMGALEALNLIDEALQS
jgi:NAD-dependent SIR2 family protein deacetylase